MSANISHASIWVLKVVLLGSGGPCKRWGLEGGGQTTGAAAPKVTEREISWAPNCSYPSEVLAEQDSLVRLPVWSHGASHTVHSEATHESPHSSSARAVPRA